MKKWLTVLWVVICVVGLGSATADSSAPTKQTSKPIKKIERLTVLRLPKEVVRIQEQSTLENNKKIAVKAEKIFRDAGVTCDKMLLAILANAWHESRWNPKETDGSCIGFFQLHKRHLGSGSTEKQLMDLTHNTNKLIKSDDFQEWVQWCKRNPKVSCGRMSFRFASLVERCASKHRNARKVTADRWHKNLSNI